MEPAPPETADQLVSLGFVIASVLIAVFLMVLLWRVAQRQGGVVIGIVGVLAVLAATVASRSVLLFFGLVWSLKLDGSALYPSLVPVLLNALIFPLVWTGVAVLLVRAGKAGR